MRSTSYRAKGAIVNVLGHVHCDVQAQSLIRRLTPRNEAFMTSCIPLAARFSYENTGYHHSFLSPTPLRLE
jgi:hypothetical protein